MTSFTTISNASLVVGEPITAPQGTALRDNPLAIAEGDTTAPVNQAVWHPYDKVTNGDANIGRIYDSATEGALTAVESGTFVAGFEYRFRYWLPMSASDDLLFQGWNGSAWVTVCTTPAASTRHEGSFEMGFGMRLLIDQRLSTSSADVAAEHSSGTAGFPYTKMRIVRASGGVTFTGKIWLDKRRAYNVF